MSAKVIERVAKLLKLATSDNVHEAASAAAQAQRLMVKHQISTEMVRDLEDDEPVDRGPMGQWDAGEHTAVSAWRWDLAWGVSEPNGCKPWRRDKRSKQVITTVIGRESDAQTAAYRYRHLGREIDRLAKREHGMGRSYISAFRHGAVTEVSRRLRLAKREAEDAMRAAAIESTALVRVNDAIERVKISGEQAQQWMREEMHFSYGSGASRTVGSVGGYRAGKQAGASIQLSSSGHALGAGRGRLKG